jgi:hypothetical protein
MKFLLEITLYMEREDRFFFPFFPQQLYILHMSLVRRALIMLLMRWAEVTPPVRER